jgi:predicted DNA-binding transcriptional regulator YafY
MRRADRLFQILQILRRTRRPTTAEAIAAELEVSKRSVYRDIADLIAQRTPIRGEAGVGYVLEDGFDMPPLMLTSDEIEAAVLGAQWVSRRGDPTLARAAEDLIAKIVAAVPERLREFALDPVSGTPPNFNPKIDGLDLAQVRAAIRAGHKIVLDYADEHGRPSQRAVWPVMIGYRDAERVLFAWCELRQDFRTFRTDRIKDAVFPQERFPERRAVLKSKWRQHMEQRPMGRS